MGVSARIGSGLLPDAPSPLGFPPTAPTLARFFSNSFSLSLSFELMYMRPLWLRACFLPQLSWDDCLRSSWLVFGATPLSMETFPMLWASSTEPLEDGRELLRSIDLKPAFSRTGDFGAVRGEKPEGGFAVRITGGLAASSSRDTPSSTFSSCDGC